MSAENTMEPLKDLVDEWLLLDKNEETRKKVQGLLARNDFDGLEKCMRPRIQFGTAGLRGKMEAGWARMNDLTVIQASQGLCEYALKHVHSAASRGVVVGHDHRHHSEKWAELTAAAFLARGVKVYLLAGLVHTPLVPFSVKKLNAACGVMITASHNPKQDNGYKVYWENAVQIIEPHDKGIALAIEANLQPKAWSLIGDSDSSHLLDRNRTEDMQKAYFEHLASLSHNRNLNSLTELPFVNTSMHGVSQPFVSKAFQICGFPSYVPVREQMHPDPEFPTVKFPNPEEKGALDLALKTAREHNAKYVLAQDPDADRFAAVEIGPKGEAIAFTGDQLGVIFAHSCLERYKAYKKPLNKLAMIASTVSSKMLEAMALKEGFHFAECLTGFKYIGNTALRLEKEGYEIPFGYEEAIGFMFGSEIRDKDGVAATVVFAETAVALHEQGKTVSMHLQELYERYGYFQTSNGYFICYDQKIITEIFARIRDYNGGATTDIPSYPKTLAGLQVTSVRDLTVGYDSANPPTFKPTLPLSSGHMIQFRAESPLNGTKITLTTRTSGTEPKIKYYLEGSGKDAAQVTQLLHAVVLELSRDWMEAEKHGLGHS